MVHARLGVGAVRGRHDYWLIGSETENGVRNHSQLGIIENRHVEFLDGESSVR
jgi:hypothetical protein